MADRQERADRGAGVRNRLRYRFDNLLSRGMWAVLMWLGALTLLAVFISSLLLALFGVTFTGSGDTSLVEDFWQSLLRVIDAGTMAGDVGWGRRLLALLVTVFGILIAGTLIGLIASGIEQRVEAMRRGRSTVVETGHVVILGSSPRLPIVIEQLALANRKRRPLPIVVLSEEEPADLQDEVRAALPRRHGSRIVFRRGNPARAADLPTVAVADAAAIVVLAGDMGDAGVVKSVLAAGAEVGGFDRKPIIAELSELETAETLLRATGGSQVHPVVALQSVARTAAFALREPGLSQVVEQLLDFRGSDIHIRGLGPLAGRSFGEAVNGFDDVRPIGIMRSEGTVDINPAADTVMQDGDRLVVIADDAESSAQSDPEEASNVPRPDPSATHNLYRPPQKEHYLILGWNPLGTRLLAELDLFAAPGSTAEVVYDSRLLEHEELQLPPTSQIAVTPRPTIDTATASLNDLRASTITSIVLLGYRGSLSPTESDARTLLTLMLLRRELASRDGAAPRIIVELFETDNVELARLSGADDYVVSEGMASRFMAQLARQPERRAVFLALYARDSPSLHVIPASAIGLIGRRSWAEIITHTYSMGLLVIGSLHMGSDRNDLVLNPHRSSEVTLADSDRLVVIG